MPRWMKPTEELPENVECGDRIVIIVAERMDVYSSIVPRLVIIEAVEDGWKCDDDTYQGYGPEDGVLWAYEKDVVEIANVVYSS